MRAVTIGAAMGSLRLPVPGPERLPGAKHQEDGVAVRTVADEPGWDSGSG